MRLAAVLAVCFAAVGLAHAQPSPTVNVSVPSTSTGGGNLAVRLTLPPMSIGARYPEGAPVLVFAPGGQKTGTLSEGANYAQQGFVVVTFLFPGGSNAGYQSDGFYDYRGANCIAALRDVLLYAGGHKMDTLGRTITTVLAPPPFSLTPITSRVGMIGSSNGGPISMATLATYGADLDFVATYVGWENPTNSQTVLGDAGSMFHDCDDMVDGDGNGIATDDGKNPYLTGYDAASIPMDFNRLAYDAAVTSTLMDAAGLHPALVLNGILFLDGNGNGVLDAAPGEPECTDADGNGRIDFGEDYRLRPLASWETGTARAYYSIEVAHEAALRGLFGAMWPAVVGDSAATREYWEPRQSPTYYATLGAVRPDLNVMLCLAAADHVQASDEHVHIQQAYDGLRGGGIWCRLNPDESYYRQIFPASSPTDTPANVEVVFPQMADYDEPHPLSSSIAAIAAVMEMADRARAGNWIPDLESTVSDVVVVPGRVAAGIALSTVVLGPTTMLRWWGLTPGAASLHLYDAAGRRRAHTPLTLPHSEGEVAAAQLFDRALVPSGTYWFTFAQDSRTLSTKAVLLFR